jgi:hypothetical protein
MTAMSATKNVRRLDSSLLSLLLSLMPAEGFIDLLGIEANNHLAAN